MPPPADEQAAMQQKIMKYMMIFMGIMFFKVASGLCIYFIASSLWGIAERKFLPKAAGGSPGEPAAVAVTPRVRPGRDGGAAGARRKARGKRGIGPGVSEAEDQDLALNDSAGRVLHSLDPRS